MADPTTDEIHGHGLHEVTVEQLITPDGVLPVVLLRTHQIDGEDCHTVEAYMAKAVVEDLIAKLMLALATLDA